MKPPTVYYFEEESDDDDDPPSSSVPPPRPPTPPPKRPRSPSPVAAGVCAKSMRVALFGALAMSAAAMTTKPVDFDSSAAEFLPPPALAKKRKRAEAGSTKKKKKVKTDPVDLGAGEGIGKFVRRNSYGTWRTVPGFDPAHVLVSDQGWVRTRTGKGLDPPHAGCQIKEGYCKVGINGHEYRVHCLVLRAFHGPRPSPDLTGDHIAKYDGDKKRERSDNRACNLRWATDEQQRDNQGEHKERRSGQPIRVRRADWPKEREWVKYPSGSVADRACGVKDLRNVANPNYSTTYCKDKQGFKWLAERADPDEPQDDLPPDPDYVDAKGVSKPQPKEEWRNAVYNNGKRIKSCKVSNRGRAQFKHARGADWAHRFTPKPTDGVVYATIAGDVKCFHIAVFCSFGGTLVGDETVDHIDGDETNNLLSNLRALDKPGQGRNRTLKPVEERGNSKKHRVGCRHRDWPATTPDLEFESQRAAERALKVSNSDISANIRKKRYPKGHKHAGKFKRLTVGGFVFYKVAIKTPWEDDWGPE